MAVEMFRGPDHIAIRIAPHSACRAEGRSLLVIGFDFQCGVVATGRPRACVRAWRVHGVRFAWFRPKVILTHGFVCSPFFSRASLRSTRRARWTHVFPPLRLMRSWSLVVANSKLETMGWALQVFIAVSARGGFASLA